jgi:hypothetical protein
MDEMYSTANYAAAHRWYCRKHGILLREMYLHNGTFDLWLATNKDTCVETRRKIYWANYRAGEALAQNSL